MNRLRKYNNSYQVLITPTHRFDAGFELILGNWDDDQLKGYKINEYSTFEDAIRIASQYPDINWDQMVLWHKDIYNKLYGVLRSELLSNNFDVDLDPKLLNSHQIKNVMFDRVAIYGNRFKLGYHMNDIISFHISNPYTSVIKRLSKILLHNQSLRIVYSTNDYGIIRLVGKTDIGTQYEIVLWTSLLAQWGKWANNNKQISNQIKIKQLEQVLNKQKIVDE
ncbi:hypothetical protein BMW23_0249 [Bodo saltans virus]|uniref:Uncharacterized protein n=1 Tax=Bodo saltans virus TaxID=2024608 RepID=A0A2H4UTY0_9VIRU|nr:hypothetical protein QJ851_gp0244 [Bodo saltans virus]ATZ80307.1 hypothetical protein BMW23_0249 [Bodo saltans virus]